MKIAETAKELAWTYLSFRGRITRSRFWWSNVALNVLQMAGQFAIGMPGAVFAGASDIGPPSPARAWGAVVIGLLVLYPATAILVKRGHDRNRSAWITLSLFTLTTLGQLVAAFAAPGAGIFFSLAFIAYVVIDLLLLPSDRQENRFGPAPRHRLDGAMKPVVLEG